MTDFDLAGWWNWTVYRQVTQRRRRIQVEIAHRLPTWLKECVYIDVCVDALAKMPGNTVVPDVRITEVMDSWAR